jgi:protein ImuB
LALVGAVKNARVLVAVNDAAARAALRVGMSFADACAIYPALDWKEEAPQEDAQALLQLGQWCERYTPLVGLDAPDGLVCDITGVAHLFGGEAALARDMVKRLAGFHLHVRIGIADSVGAAWAVAHHGRTAIVPSGMVREALAPLPLAALRIAEETRIGLAQLGLKTIGEIMSRPRQPLAARFGAGLMRRLDQALGDEEEPISPLTPVAPLSAEQGFPEPVTRDEDLLAVLMDLTARLCALLEKRSEGARRMRASFFGVEGKVFRLEIGTSRPLRDAGRLTRLFTDKFSLTQWDNEFGFDRMRVCVLESESRPPAQADLTHAEDGPELSHLIDRLSARLGESRVLSVMLQDSHVPEHACVGIPAAGAREFAPGSSITEKGREQDSLAPSRPVRLFERPEIVQATAEVPDAPPAQFRWRRATHVVARVEGPERIAMPWWRDGKDCALTRDYFRVETAEGVRLWLYREGLYSETGKPKWFCHGFLP